MAEENVLKYPDIEWSLPLLFYCDYVYGVINNLFKEFGLQTPKSNVFGCPACLWSGGRGPSHYKPLTKPTITKILRYINLFGGVPSFTFTSINLSDEDLKDPYCNMILDVALAENARFIVFDDKLRDYIKSKKSDATVVASIIKPIFKFQNPAKQAKYSVDEETDYYNKLLKEYDVVVVRPEYSKYALLDNPSAIDDLSRIEVLINQQCTLNCPKAIEHYSSFESIKVDRKPYKFVCYRATTSNAEHFKYNSNSFHDEQSLKKLCKSGVKRFKIQGRSLQIPPSEVYTNTINHIVKSDGSGNMFFEQIGPRIAAEIEFYRGFVR